jgi:hypothetical protein
MKTIDMRTEMQIRRMGLCDVASGSAGSSVIATRSPLEGQIGGGLCSAG